MAGLYFWMTVVRILLITMVILYLMPYVAYLVLYLICYNVSNRREWSSKKDHQYEPYISIVIATYNEEDYIEAKLRNTLLESDYPLNKMEVIIVDCSTDNTPEIVKRWMSKFSNVKLIKEERRKGLAHALNIGFSAARGDIVIKSDCDILVEKDTIRKLANMFSDPKVGAVSARALPLSHCGHERGYRTLLNLKRRVENKLDSIYLLETLSAFRRELLEPLDEKSLADESEIALAIRKKGYKVLFNDEAVFYEPVPKSLLDRLSLRQRRAQGHIRLLIKNINMLFSRKYGKYSAIILPLNFFLIVLCPWLLLCICCLIPMMLYAVIGVWGLAIYMFLLLLGMSIYVSGRPACIAGFIESQLAALIGSIKLMIKGPEYIWSKKRGE